MWWCFFRNKIGVKGVMGRTTVGPYTFATGLTKGMNTGAKFVFLIYCCTYYIFVLNKFTFLHLWIVIHCLRTSNDDITNIEFYVKIKSMRIKGKLSEALK